MNQNSNSTASLKRLGEIDREHRLLSHASAVLHWDQETYMPEAAVQDRAEQLALLSGLMHDRITQPQIGEELGALGVKFEQDSVPRVPETFQGIERAFGHLVVCKPTDGGANKIADTANIASRFRRSDFSFPVCSVSDSGSLSRTMRSCTRFFNVWHSNILIISCLVC